jgi:betaine-aldehyde dehydrogenase
MRRKVLHNPSQLFIDGKWKTPSTDALIQIIEPFSEQILVRVAEAREADISRAIGAARTAFDSGPWPLMAPEERAKYLRALGAGLQVRGPDITRMWTPEVGILHASAVERMRRIPGVFDFYTALAEDFHFEELHPLRNGQSGFLRREPVGVVGAIIPWNAPIVTIAYKIAPALLAGCSVVLKAAPEAPSAAYILAEVAEEIGLPPGVLNVVTAHREASERLVTDPRVDKITFTGSTAAGRRIASLCGQRIARVSLELGGKSAAIILDDYDIEAAARTLAASAVDLTGQVWSSLTRVVIGRDRHDALVEALSSEFAKVKVGNPFDPDIGMGPVAMRRQYDHVLGLIAQGIRDGARLATGGGRPEGFDRGFFIQPTVLAQVDNASAVARTEIFGPVLSVILALDDDDAVTIANDSIYGLNAAVFRSDRSRALAVARRVRSGTVGQNGTQNSHAIAFGGFKQSGIGREGGREGLYPYLESKAIIMAGEA